MTITKREMVSPMCHNGEHLSARRGVRWMILKFLLLRGLSIAYTIRSRLSILFFHCSSRDLAAYMSAPASLRSERTFEACMEKQNLTLPTGVGGPTDLAWSPDGTQLAVVTDCGWLVVWGTSTGAIQVNQHLGRTFLHTAAWAHHGRALAVGGANGALYRITSLTHPKVTTHWLGHPVTHVAWSRSPIGRCLVVSGHTLTVLDGRGLPPVTKQYAMPILDAGWSPNGRTLAVVCETGPIEVWDMEPSVQIFTLSQIPDPCCLAWHRNGHQVSIGTTTGFIQVCHVRSKRHTLWSHVSTSPIHALKWGERYLAVASQTAQREFRLLDEDGQAHPQPVTHVFTWNPQGTVLARGHQQHIALATL